MNKNPEKKNRSDTPKDFPDNTLNNENLSDNMISNNISSDDLSEDIIQILDKKRNTGAPISAGQENLKALNINKEITDSKPSRPVNIQSQPQSAAPAINNARQRNTSVNMSVNQSTSGNTRPLSHSTGEQTEPQQLSAARPASQSSGIRRTTPTVPQSTEEQNIAQSPATRTTPQTQGIHRVPAHSASVSSQSAETEQTEPQQLSAARPASQSSGIRRTPSQPASPVSQTGNQDSGTTQIINTKPDLQSPGIQKTSANLSSKSPGFPRRLAEDSMNNSFSPAADNINAEDKTRIIRIGNTQKTQDPGSIGIPAQRETGTVKRNKKKKKSEGNTVVSLVKAIIYIVTILVISVSASVFIILVGNDVYAFVKSDEEITVTIPEYATLNDIADILYDNGVIKYRSIFKIYANHKKGADEFEAGEYTVSPSMDYEDLLYEFAPHPIQGTSWIQVPEGYTTDQIIDLLTEKGIGTKEKYIDVINNYDFDYWFVKELDEKGWDKDRIYRLDGYLFPDKYEFYNSSSEVTVINKFLKRFSQIYTKEYRDAANQMGMSTDEIITLASMIEKEGGNSTDFFSVSSVFHNRMKDPAQFPRFESDATVLYYIHHETGERPKRVTHDDTEIDTKYNTYKYEGFPPGPIANPSATAIVAALNPIDTNYYYFFSNEGITYFSTSYWEHENKMREVYGTN